MKRFETIELTTEGKLGVLLLNRPDKHNAMNALMIAEIRDAILEFTEDLSVKIIVIRARGKSFSSGADLNYMKQQADMDREENLRDSKNLANMFYEIYSCPKPVISVAHGVIAGGANGIVAASDYALTTHDALFRFSEVHLGLIPATISPYVTDRIGRARAMELFLSTRPFSGKEAASYNLVNKSVDENEIEQSLNEITAFFMKSAPAALEHTKKLILDLNGADQFRKMIDKTSLLIAEARSSAEGQEGINSFFEKRKPNWIDEII
jgi:methylglutaconyl-CoA hydratase